MRKIDQVKKKLASLTSDSTLQSEEETTLRTTLAKLNEDLSYIVVSMVMISDTAQL